MMDQYEEYDTEERLASAERALYDEIEQRDKNEWRNHDQVGELRQQLAAHATEIEKWRDIEAPRLEAELKSLKALRGQEIKSYEAWIKRLQDEIERLKSLLGRAGERLPHEVTCSSRKLLKADEVEPPCDCIIAEIKEQCGE